MKKQHNEALKLAIRLLSLRDRTEAEIRHKLELKGFSLEEIENVVNCLKSKGFIDDSKFIKKIGHIAENRLLGEVGVKNYLLKRGIEREILESAPKFDEFVIAQKLLQKKERFFKDVSPDKRKAKMAGFLLRRGFSWDTVNRCLKEEKALFRDSESQ